MATPQPQRRRLGTFTIVHPGTDEAVPLDAGNRVHVEVDFSGAWQQFRAGIYSCCESQPSFDACQLLQISGQSATGEVPVSFLDAFDIPESSKCIVVYGVDADGGQSHQSNPFRIEGASSGSGVGTASGSRCGNCSGDDPLPVTLQLTHAGGIFSVVCDDCEALNDDALLQHSGDPCFACCWYGDAILFCGDEAGYWKLEKTDPQTWVLSLLQTREDLPPLSRVTYTATTAAGECSFPIDLQLDPGSASVDCDGWPDTIRIELPEDVPSAPLPLCRWRGELRDDRYVCRSAMFVGPPNLVREDFCRRCHCIDHQPPPLPKRLPCVHRGGATSDGAGPGLFACALHGQCVAASEGADTTGDRRCADCSDYLAREPFAADSARMRNRAEAFLAAVPTYPKDRYQGRGAVLVGGGRYFASLYVTLRALRHSGWRLPIQVWYLGRQAEMPSDRQALLASYGVECIDADVVRERHPTRILNGWELKVFATLHSPFEELLFLDADCYPCRNPEFLFDLEDYRACGAVFWPDMDLVDDRLKWTAYGVSDPHRLGSVESGQYVLHKRLCWRPLNLTWFYNDHSDYYYRYGYGDKHTFEAAWARCETPFVMWNPHAHWAEVAYLHPGPDGLPLFVHRCADKFRLESATFVTRQSQPAYRPHLPLERECWGWLSELVQALGLETYGHLCPP